MDQQHVLREGMTVYGADGDKVGKVVAVDPAYVVVEKGFFFPTDYYVPVSAVASATDDEVYLTVAKDEAVNQGWDQPLATTEAFQAPRAATTDAYDTAPEATAATAAGFEQHDRPFDHEVAGRIGEHEAERLRVPVHEEELEAVKRERERGAVRVEKDVVAEERTLDVPVTEERVRVRQVAADPNAPADPSAFEEGTIEVPIHGEEVELRKTARQVGAVEVEKEAVARTERVGGTVRKEQVRVDDQTLEPLADAGDAAAETERGP